MPALIHDTAFIRGKVVSKILFSYSQLSLYRSRRDLYYLFDITEFRYEESDINGLEVIGGNINLDISGYFVISEFYIEGVDCIFAIVFTSDGCVILREYNPGNFTRFGAIYSQIHDINCRLPN